MKYPYELVCDKCGGSAFYLKIKPAYGDLLLASDCVLLDGSLPQPSTPAICGTCGRPPAGRSELVIGRRAREDAVGMYRTIAEL